VGRTPSFQTSETSLLPAGTFRDQLRSSRWTSTGVGSAVPPQPAPAPGQRTDTTEASRSFTWTRSAMSVPGTADDATGGRVATIPPIPPEAAPEMMPAAEIGVVRPRAGRVPTKLSPDRPPSVSFAESRSPNARWIGGRLGIGMLGGPAGPGVGGVPGVAGAGLGPAPSARTPQLFATDS
jgi:hypothetical protein